VHCSLGGHGHVLRARRTVHRPSFRWQGGMASAPHGALRGPGAEGKRSVRPQDETTDSWPGQALQNDTHVTARRLVRTDANARAAGASPSSGRCHA